MAAATAGAQLWGTNPDPLSCSCHPALLLALLGLLSVPGARGDCGPPPAMAHSRPSIAELPSSFPVGSRVTFRCAEGARKIPGLPDTVECLPGDIWSRLREPCGRSCSAPTRLRFAALSKEDERKNFFPVGTNVSYVCRPGYENTSGSSPSSTCLENLTWSEPAELCRRRSCGAPAALPGGRTGPLSDLRLGARVDVFCDDGYKLVGNNFIWCQLKGNDVEWSEFPTCELITCSAPPHISHGRHDGEGAEMFAYNSTVTFSCEPNFELVGNGKIHCTSGDKSSGAWSGAVPECKEKSSAVRPRAKDTEGRVPPKSPQGNGIRPSKKVLTWEMKLSLYKKALQNTISSSQSSSFFRKRENRNCPISELRFVLPLYKSPKYHSGTSKGSTCPPKSIGILPPPGCFQNLKWPKVASFCGRRRWAARRSWAWRKCCSSTFPPRCKGLFYA